MDLKDDGESVCKNRIHRIMRSAGIRSQRGYKRHPGFRGGGLSHVAPNTLARSFIVDDPNESWVTDFAFVRTHEGWLYLTVVIDLLHRQVIGWSMKNNPRSDLVIDDLMMALWRRKPKGEVLIYSDQCVQYTSSDWRSFLKDNNLEASMSRKGNYHDNAVAKSFLSNLKTERIRRKIYKTRDEARTDIFNNIELFYNPKRRHSANEGLSPVEFEKQHFRKLSTV